MPAIHSRATPEHLHLIGKGRLSMGDKDGAPVLGKGEFWGSDSLFQSMSPNAQEQKAAPEPLPQAIALDRCEIYSVPLPMVARIPVVRWKLFEAFRNTHPYAAPRYRGTAR
jgi:hypothetical protein